MLNDVKLPPLHIGPPDPTPNGPSPTGPVISRPGTAHQPPAHREVLEGHPDLPRREPASANTPGYVNEREHLVGGDAASLNPRVPDPVVRGARKGDTPDGGVYEYPTRGSFDTLALSIVVVVLVLGVVGYLVTRMF